MIRFHHRIAISSKTGLRAISLVLPVALLLLGPPAMAKHNGATMMDDRGLFQISGNAAKNACTAETRLNSAAANKVGLSIYWRPSQSIHLLVRHPAFQSSAAKQTLRFRFPDGTEMTFRLKQYGKIAQMPLGLETVVSSLFHAIKKNTSVTIDLVDVGDSIELDLSERKAVEDGMEACRQWLA